MISKSPRLSPRAVGRRAGFALLAVIWGVGLIAMLIVGFLTNSRLRLQTAHNIARAAEAGYIAESAINLAALAVLSSRDAAQMEGAPADGAPRFCVLDGAAVALAMEDEGGKIDLNASSPELLTAALVGLGVKDGMAREAAKAIVAYRTPANGAIGQIRATPANGKPIQPKQGLFETVLELDQVSGIDAALFRALIPFVTVHSRISGVDPRSSPPALFAALAGFPIEDVRALIASPYPNALNRKDPRFPATYNQSGDHAAYLIHAEVLLATGQLAAKDALLDLRPPNGKSFAYKEMRRGQSKYAARLRAMIAANGAGASDC